MPMHGNFLTESISLYFHIPFCTRKCDYCHFYVLPDKDPLKSLLIKGFELEWHYRLPLIHGHPIETIYLGGGTPSLLSPMAIEALLNQIRSDCSFVSNNIEITLEANPESIDLQRMRDYALAGINRVSIGIQTFDDQLLKQIGRLHDAKTAKTSIQTVFDAGIENITIDLMYDLPNQSLDSWNQTLDTVTTLPIKHLSLYNLTIEPHTVFHKYRKKIEAEQPEESDSLLMVETAFRRLQEMGLKHYEISAFAKEGCQSRHNKGYWTGRPFLGFGPSAFSFWDGSRFRNPSHLHKWLRALEENREPADFTESLPPLSARAERLAVQLRLLEGVSLLEFEKKNGPLSNEVYESLNHLVEDGFLKKAKDHFSLSSKGILFYDTVATELIIL